MVEERGIETEEPPQIGRWEEGVLTGSGEVAKFYVATRKKM